MVAGYVFEPSKCSQDFDQEQFGEFQIMKLIIIITYIPYNNILCSDIWGFQRYELNIKIIEG